MQHPADTVLRIAEVAEAVARQAGVGGCETAGAIISYLAKHPDQVADFMEHGSGFLIDTAPADLRANGRLTFHRKGDAKVVTPKIFASARPSTILQNQSHNRGAVMRIEIICSVCSAEFTTDKLPCICPECSRQCGEDDERYEEPEEDDGEGPFTRSNSFGEN